MRVFSEGNIAMDILFKRKQSSTPRGKVSFQLWAKTEVTEEESELIGKYSMHDAVLIHVFEPHLLRRAVLVGLLGAILSWFIVIGWLLRAVGLYLPFPISLVLALTLGGLLGLVYHNNHRETIMVKDLLYGRFFNCKSVIELARKEAYLQNVASYFRQVIESAKHWGGQQSIPVEPLSPEDAKRAILSGPLL